MEFIEVKGAKTQAELKTDSSSWGNYRYASFDVKREQGLYTTAPNTKASWDTTKDYTKPGSSVLLTTGATDRNCAFGIYDLAGNLYEWTLERANSTTITYVSDLSIMRGSYYSDGSGSAYQSNYIISFSIRDIGLRSALW